MLYRMKLFHNEYRRENYCRRCSCGLLKTNYSIDKHLTYLRSTFRLISKEVCDISTIIPLQSMHLYPDFSHFSTFCIKSKQALYIMHHSLYEMMVHGVKIPLCNGPWPSLPIRLIIQICWHLHYLKTTEIDLTTLNSYHLYWIT